MIKYEEKNRERINKEMVVECIRKMKMKDKQCMGPVWEVKKIVG